MTLVAIQKTPSYFSRYQVKYRRRREGKTDYRQRRRLITQALDKYQSKKYRFIVRRTNNRIICQVAYATIKGDFIIASADSSELIRYGMPVGQSNYAAAYATGLLCARRCLKHLGLDSQFKAVDEVTGENHEIEAEDGETSPFVAFLDIGLVRCTTGARVFGALKGAIDGGLNIPHSDKHFPGYDKETKEVNTEIHRDRIFAKHVADYMRKLQEEDPARYEKQFSRYIKQGITADNLEEKIAAVHKAIRDDFQHVKKEKKSYTYERQGHYIIITNSAGKQTKIFRPRKLTCAERAERVQKKIEEIARLAAEAVDVE